jgi:RHS repeat-associated protein
LRSVWRVRRWGAGLGAAAAEADRLPPASQIKQNTRSNDAYAWNGHYNVTRSYTSNGLNQYTASGSLTLSYDANGNLISDGTTSYVYDDENRLVSASGGHAAILAYDPLGRLWQVSSTSTGTTRFFYDGDRLAIESDGSSNLLRAYVHGDGADQPLVWYEAVSGGTSRRFLHADERGSVTAVADQSGNEIAVNGYDEYGIPNSGNQGRFGYTGQAWIPELGMWYYKARIYSPTLGRFMQTDPAGYEGSGTNLYAYVNADPVNLVDSLGLKSGDIFSGVAAAMKDATAYYFRRNGHEWGGGLYRYKDNTGSTRFMYSAFEGDVHAGVLALVTSGNCDGHTCDLIAVWHTQNTKPYMGWEDKIAADQIGYPYIMGYGNNVYIYYPKGSTYKGSPNPRAGVTFRFHEDTTEFEPTLTDMITNSWRQRFGPGGTADMIAYLMHCVVGEVDLCSEDQSSIGPVLDPRILSSDGGGE